MALQNIFFYIWITIVLTLAQSTTILANQGSYVDISHLIDPTDYEYGFISKEYNKYQKVTLVNGQQKTLDVIVEDVAQKFNFNLSTTYKFNKVTFYKVTVRQGNDANPYPDALFCKVQENLARPYFMKDINGDDRVILQSKNFMQNIWRKTCEKDIRGQSLPKLPFRWSNELPNLHCEQKYLDMQFVVLNKTLDGIEIISSQHGVPIVCACVYYK